MLVNNYVLDGSNVNIIQHDKLNGDWAKELRGCPLVMV